MLEGIARTGATAAVEAADLLRRAKRGDGYVVLDRVTGRAWVSYTNEDGACKLDSCSTMHASMSLVIQAMEQGVYVERSNPN
jgi:hypothetical protein